MGEKNISVTMVRSTGRKSEPYYITPLEIYVGSPYSNLITVSHGGGGFEALLLPLWRNSAASTSISWDQSTPRGYPLRWKQIFLSSCLSGPALWGLESNTVRGYFCGSGRSYPSPKPLKATIYLLFIATMQEVSPLRLHKSPLSQNHVEMADAG